MKVISYKRYARAPFHIHAGSSARCMFVPDKNVIICAETLGSFGSTKYYVVRKKELLDEARAIQEERITEKPLYGGLGGEKAWFIDGGDPSVSFSAINALGNIEYPIVEGLIEKIDMMDHLEKQVEDFAKTFLS